MVREPVLLGESLLALVTQPDSWMFPRAPGSQLQGKPSVWCEREVVWLGQRIAFWEKAVAWSEPGSSSLRLAAAIFTRWPSATTRAVSQSLHPPSAFSITPAASIRHISACRTATIHSRRTHCLPRPLIIDPSDPQTQDSTCGLLRDAPDENASTSPVRPSNISSSLPEYS